MTKADFIACIVLVAILLTLAFFAGRVSAPIPEPVQVEVTPPEPKISL